MTLGLILHRLVGHRVITGEWSDGQRVGWCRTCEPDYYDRYRRGRILRPEEPGVIPRGARAVPAPPRPKPAEGAQEAPPTPSVRRRAG